MPPQTAYINVPVSSPLSLQISPQYHNQQHLLWPIAGPPTNLNSAFPQSAQPHQTQQSPQDLQFFFRK
jgi:hypothetical protein